MQVGCIYYFRARVMGLDPRTWVSRTRPPPPPPLSPIYFPGPPPAAPAARAAGIPVAVGHAAENLFLQATALGIATVVVGAFDDAAVTRLLRLEPGEEPLVLMPLGRLDRR